MHVNNHNTYVTKKGLSDVHQSFSVLHAKDQTDDHQCTHAHTCIHTIHTQYYDNFGIPDLQTTEIE